MSVNFLVILLLVLINHTAQIKMAFLDDRKTKLLRDQREREQREARAAAATKAALEGQQVPSESMGSPAPSSPGTNMPGVGHTLADVDGGEDSD